MAIGDRVTGVAVGAAGGRGRGAGAGVSPVVQALLDQGATSPSAARQVQGLATGNMTASEFAAAQGMTPYAIPQFGAGGNAVRTFTPAMPMGPAGSTGAGMPMGNPLPQMTGQTGVGATAAGDSAILRAAGLPTAESAALGVAETAPLVAGAEGAAAAAGKGGFLKNIIGKIPFANVAKARPGLGIGVGIGGQVLGGMVDSMNIGGENSNIDQSLSGGIEGAGIGGALALGLGLTGPVGWAVAGTGALLGAIFSAQEEGGTTQERMQKTATNTTKTIQELTATYGLSPEDAQDIMLQHDAATRLFIQNKDKAGLDAYVQQLSSVLPQQMLQMKQARDQEASHYKRVMDMQAQFAPMFSSIMGRAAESNTVAYEQAVKAADTLKADNPQLAALIQTSAADSRSNSDALMAAYASQIAMAPSQQEYQNYYAGQSIYNANTTGNGSVSGTGGLTTSQQNQLAQLQALTAAGY